MKELADELGVPVTTYDETNAALQRHPATAEQIELLQKIAAMLGKEPPAGLNASSAYHAIEAALRVLSPRVIEERNWGQGSVLGLGNQLYYVADVTQHGTLKLVPIELSASSGGPAKIKQLPGKATFKSAFLVENAETIDRNTWLPNE